MKKIDEYISQVETLPPAPQVLVRLMSLLGEPDVDAHRIVEQVEVDPALTAKVLQRCNSTAFGGAEPVDHLDQAVTRLGFNEVYRLTATVIAESTLSAPQAGYGLDAGDLWRHSAATAMAAKVVAKTLGEDENVIFTAGLLHDLGKLVLSASLLAHPGEVASAGTSELSFVETEKAMLGAEHAEVGGRVLQRWGFSEKLVRAVWHHHEPLLARPFEQAASCVYLADMIAHALGYGPGLQSYAIRGRGEVMELLEITAADLDRMMLLTEAALKKSEWFTPAP